MGKLGPDGIDESTRIQVEIPEVDAYDATVSPAEPAPQETTETLPELTLENFAQDWAAQSPDEAMKLFGALQREIYEAFGIAENNPDAIDLEAQSRIEALQQAVQSNQPEEIEQSLNSLFDGSIDSPARLNELASLMIGQGGGNFEGLSIGGKNPLSEEQLRAKREQERSANAATLQSAAEAAAQIAANIAASVMANYAETFKALNDWYVQNAGKPFDEQVEHGVNESRPAYQDIVDGIMDEFDRTHPNATEEERNLRIQQAIAQAERSIADGIKTAPPEVERGVLEQLRAEETARLEAERAATTNALKYAIDGMKGFSADASLSEVREALSDNLTEQIRLLNNSIYNANNALENEQSRINPNVDTIAGLTQFRDIQQIKLNISVEAFAFQNTVFDELAAQGKELSTLEMADIQKIIFDMPEDLIGEMQKLHELAPDQDPMQLFDGLLSQFTEENGYSAEQIAEVEKMMGDLKDLVTAKSTAIGTAMAAMDQQSKLDAKLAAAEAKLAEAEAKEAELTEALGQAWDELYTMYEGSDFVPVVGPTSGPLSPISNPEQEAYYLEQARYQEIQNVIQLREEAEALQAEALELEATIDQALFAASQAETTLAHMREGKTYEEAKAIADAMTPPEPPAPPEPEVEEEPVVVAEAAEVAEEEEWDRSNYSYLEDRANDVVDEILASGEPITMEQLEAMATHEQLLGAYGENGILMVKAILEEKAPAYEFSDGPLPAHYVELNVAKEIYDDMSLDSISKEEIMNRLADAGLSGEQLEASTEQVIADLQTDIGMDFVTGLSWPTDNADAVYGTDHTIEEEPEEPTPVANEGPAPKEQEFVYNSSSTPSVNI